MNTTNCLQDRDGPLQDALDNIFPPSKFFFARKEQLDLYVEFETHRVVDEKSDAPADIVQDVAQYLGAEVEDPAVRKAIDSFATPRLYPTAQCTIETLVRSGYTPVALPTTTYTEALSQIQELSLCLFDVSPKKQPFSWDSLIAFSRNTYSDIRPNIGRGS